MKKILLCLLTIFLSSACTSKSKAVELNHDQLMKGDFSSIAGEYVNPKGETVVINNQGLREGEVSQDEIYYLNGIYQMPIRRPENEPEGGYTLTVYPVDVEIEDLDSDIAKVRISYGQASPTSKDQIHTKK